MPPDYLREELSDTKKFLSSAFRILQQGGTSEQREELIIVLFRIRDRVVYVLESYCDELSINDMESQEILDLSTDCQELDIHYFLYLIQTYQQRENTSCEINIYQRYCSIVTFLEQHGETSLPVSNLDDTLFRDPEIQGVESLVNTHIRSRLSDAMIILHTLRKSYEERNVSRRHIILQLIVLHEELKRYFDNIYEEFLEHNCTLIESTIDAFDESTDSLSQLLISEDDDIVYSLIGRLQEYAQRILAYIKKILDAQVSQHGKLKPSQKYAPFSPEYVPITE